MREREIDLLAIDRGIVTSPAGCGKTQLIAEALTRHADDKPILVLTHTNAGVAALRGRLDQACVPREAYRLSTIDGWAMRLISMFPVRSAHNPDILAVDNPRSDYPNIRDAAARLLQSGHIGEILQATYSRLIVDEYQDCSVSQHAVVVYAAQVLPTCVLGDPMQAIFGFGSNQLAQWNEQVCAYFPESGQLNKPWRWINADSETLGAWLLDVRGRLMRGEPVDLRQAPDAVTWIQLDGTNDHQKRMCAARARPPQNNDRVLIIGDSRSANKRHQIASKTPGAITVETVELKELIRFSRDFDPSAPDALDQLVRFAQSVMINVGAAKLVRRVESLRRGAARKPPSNVERKALAFVETPSYGTARKLLAAINWESGVRAHRPAVLKACLRAMLLCDGAKGMTFYDGAMRIREQNRFAGRSLPRRAVGSTLLLKGLEAEVAVVLNADDLDARNLYVAMTRGSKMLTVCSRTPILNQN